MKITELIERINIEIVGAAYEGYQVTANKLLRYIDVIRAEILMEKICSSALVSSLQIQII